MMGMLFIVGLPFLMMQGGHPSHPASTPVPHQTAIAKYSTQEIRSGFDMSKVLTYDNPPNLCQSRRTVPMPGPLPKYPIQLTPEQARSLQQLSTCYTAPFAEVQRARILLL